jgi:tetratricopeptide (TPR) repeat protein
MKKYIGISLCVVAFWAMQSCDDFLNVKQDKKMLVPNSLDDCEALLDDRATMNAAFPVIGEVASDQYYLPSSNWAALANEAERNCYVWDAQTDVNVTNWQGPYKAILVANQVLYILDQINTSDDIGRANILKGRALFFRAYAYAQLADVFTLAYEPSGADEALGLPLRLSPNVDVVSVRSSLKETYRQMVDDLQKAIALLPEQAEPKTRPSKVAAYAALARIALVMEDVELAIQAAKNVLAIQDQLLDYNTLNRNLTAPFQRFNTEVLFHATTISSPALGTANARVDSSLFRSYHDGDLRKHLYFTGSNDTDQSFKGKYDGEVSASSFAGIAIDEVYFTLAEAYARKGQLDLALSMLNKLMKTRWDQDTFIPFTARDKDEALGLILTERQKSLLFRNVRWADLKRLNKEPSFRKILYRKIDGNEHELAVMDLRYAFLIPKRAMAQASGIIQNKR